MNAARRKESDFIRAVISDSDSDRLFLNYKYPIPPPLTSIQTAVLPLSRDEKSDDNNNNNNNMQASLK